MKRLYSKTDLNGMSEYGLLRNAVIQHLDIAQFANYRSPSTYEDLKRTVENVAASRDDLNTTRSAVRSVDRGTLAILLMRSGTDRGQEGFESKFEAITKQMAELSLMMRKNIENRWWCFELACYYCTEPGILPSVFIGPHILVLDVWRVGRLRRRQRRARLALKEKSDQEYHLLVRRDPKTIVARNQSPLSRKPIVRRLMTPKWAQS